MSALSRIHRGQLVSIGVVAAVIGLGVAAATGSLSSSSGHTITAEFADAQSISKGNTVHVDGVTAGTVTSIRLVHNKAYLTLHLADGFWPIHADATADVRPVSLLGEDYVQLDPGSASAPVMANGGTIKAAHTTNSVNLQSVLDAINDPTSTALALLITTFGQGMAGQGGNSADDLKALAPALNNTTALTDLLDQQDKTLTQLLDQVTPVTRALTTDNGATLASLVKDSETTLAATSKQSTALGADLRELPTFLANTTTAFNQLGRLSDQATPALQALDPFTNNLVAFSGELKSFADAAQPAVADLTPVLNQVDNFLTQTGPVVTSLRASAPAMVPDAASLIPIVQQGFTGACTTTACPGLDNIFGFVRNWSLATQNYDGLSHYFRFFTNFSATPVSGLPGVGTLLGALSTASTGPAAAPAAPAVPTVPAVTVPSTPVTVPSTPLTLPSVPSLGQAISNGVAKVLGPVAPPVSTPAIGSGQSATGLSPTQEQNLFSYLLGGL